MAESISAETLADRDVTLVCAYDDEAKCRELGISGALTLKEFRAKAPLTAKNRELVFFCA